MITVEIEFFPDGTARIKLPEGTLKAKNSGEIAKLTEKIAKGLGPILERHAAHTHIYLDDGTEKVVWHQEQGGGDHHHG
jgi:hypothetical protein